MVLEIVVTVMLKGAAGGAVDRDSVSVQSENEGREDSKGVKA